MPSCVIPGVLNVLLKFLANKLDVPFLLLGYVDPSLDRHPSGSNRSAAKPTMQSWFLQEVRWIDLWRHKFPDKNNFRVLKDT